MAGINPKTGKPRRRTDDDWAKLKDEWVLSGMPKVAFLASRGINAAAGRAWLKTRDWEPSAEAKPLNILRANPAAAAEAATGKVTIEADAAVAAATNGRRSVDTTPEPMPANWRLIEQWRAKQAVEDWKTADSLRAHIKLILRGALREVVDEATGRREWRSTLKPHETRQLAVASGEVQRIQRLAVGLSTENVGIEQAGTHVEAVTATVEDEKPIPTYIVEMSRRGRFVRPKPRRVS